MSHRSKCNRERFLGSIGRPEVCGLRDERPVSAAAKCASVAQHSAMGWHGMAQQLGAMQAHAETPSNMLERGRRYRGGMACTGRVLPTDRKDKAAGVTRTSRSGVGRRSEAPEEWCHAQARTAVSGTARRGIRLTGTGTGTGAGTGAGAGTDRYRSRCRYRVGRSVPKIPYKYKSKMSVLKYYTGQVSLGGRISGLRKIAKISSAAPRQNKVDLDKSLKSLRPLRGRIKWT